MGTTPAYGWPYPAPTDPVAEGAANIEALAEAIEPVVNRHEYLVKTGATERTGHFMMLGGTGVVTTDATGAFVVGFAPRAFAGDNPTAFCNVFSDFNWWCNVIGVNVTGFSAKVYNGTGGIVANNTLSIQWSAFGVVAL